MRTPSTTIRRALAPLLLALALTACGGGGDDDEGVQLDDSGSSSDSGGTDGGGSDTTATTETTDTTTEAALDAPADSFEMADICGTGRGFRDLPAYEAGPGLHPIALFDGEEDDPSSWIYASYELPEGWGPDLAFADEGDLAEVELVGCVSQTSVTGTGVDCEFDDDGDTFTLELADASYDIRVIEASTGDEVDTFSVDASEDGECPFFVTISEGDTQHVSRLDDEQVVATLTGVVEP